MGPNVDLSEDMPTKLSFFHHALSDLHGHIYIFVDMGTLPAAKDQFLYKNLITYSSVWCYTIPETQNRNSGRTQEPQFLHLSLIRS